MSFFSKLLYGENGCTECGATSSMAPAKDSWEVARIPFEQRLHDLRSFLDIRSNTTDPVCREDFRTNQVECQLYPGSGFRPENVEINMRGRQIEVKARQEDKSNDGLNYSLKEIRRTFTFPSRADIDQFTATMESDGMLILRAPLLKEASVAQDGPIPLQINRE